MSEMGCSVSRAKNAATTEAAETDFNSGPGSAVPPDPNDPYPYAPLDSESNQIRVVILLPSKDKSAQIQLEVVHLPFEQLADSYIALSYTWGDKSDTVPISVHSYTMNITRNLESALRHIRYEEHEVPLWIDSICIDQTNLKERTEQVLLMKEIYSNARSVIAWIGEANDNTEKAYKLILDLTSKFLEYELRPHDDVRDWLCKAVVDKDLYSWDGVLELIGRPYFARVWIIQEIALAKKTSIRCGDHSLPYECFMMIPGAGLSYQHDILGARTNMRTAELAASGQPIILTKVIKDAQAEHSVGFHYILHITTAQQYIKVDKYDTFYDIVRAFRDSDSTDPRDKLYALLGLAATKHTEIAAIKPDYTRSLEEVYCHYIRTHAEAYNRLDFLWDACGPDGPEGFPSWVPHYGKPEEVSVMRFKEISGHITFAAASQVPPVYEFVNSGRGLKVAAIAIGSVAKISKKLVLEDDNMEVAFRLAKIGTDLISATMTTWAEMAGAADKYAILRRTGPPPQEGMAAREQRADSSSVPLEKLMSRVEIDEKLAKIPKGAPIAAVLQVPAEAEDHPYSFVTNEEFKQQPGDQVVFIEPAAKYVDGSPIKTAFTRTTVMNPSASMDIDYIHNDHWISTPQSSEAQDSVHMDFGKYHKARRAEVCSNRKFFVTDTGYMGVAVAKAEVGDIVTVVLGTKVPLLMRKQSDGKYLLIGESYVQGLMSGEAVGMMNEGKIASQVFHLV